MKINSGIIELNKSEIKALQTLIDHARQDLSYGEGSSYVDLDGEPDKKAVKQAEEAIFIINKLIEIN